MKDNLNLDEVLIAQIRQNLDEVQKNICIALKHSHRSEGIVKIVTVSKRKSIEHVKAAYACGMRVFGENYPEMGQEKIDALWDYGDIEWHMIGHIQSRKVKLVAENFQMVHSIDSIRIAEKLNNSCIEANTQIPILVEVNISGEESKFGFAAWNKDDWQKLADSLAELEGYDHLIPSGLMTMPPFCVDPDKSRSYFTKTVLLRDFLQTRLCGMEWKELSMGTSIDYMVAVEEGATMVRIGEAILGKRP